MSNMVTITIDGKKCEAKEGEFILNVARANDIFIPAICYLNRCTPTLACRLCLVEADGKQVYSCNAKAKQGMEITTVSENIIKERRAIMEVYDVNHPLQCGVCDQSGECELQNYSLYMGVDSQSYAVPDVHRPASNWGVMKYDPGLCIVCEKCVTVCKDMIGSAALSTVKRGAEALDKEYKASMPKDAYAMWNKLNKSLIGFDEQKCIDCGECIAVCPVGALVSSDFQYTTNAWELEKIPAANPHSSDCSFLYYEVKAKSIEKNQEQKIYRVTNESHYDSLNGAARFGYDFENSVTQKNSQAFEKAIKAFEDADTVVFNSFITNEEALILQKLKEKFDLKLVNHDAMAFKKFLDAYSQVSNQSLYSGDLDKVRQSNFVVSVGSYLKSDLPAARYAFNNAISMNKGAGLYFHPLQDTSVAGFGKKGKTIETIFHPPLAEEAVLYFILDQFGKDLPDQVKKYLEEQKEQRTKTVTETVKEKVTEVVVDTETGEEKEVSKMVPKKVEKEVEYTYTKLLDMMGTDESLLETIEAMLAKKDTYSLIVGEDLISHPKSENLAKLCGLIEKYTDFSVTIIPPSTNTLGVSQICDLDSECGKNVIGYNESGDFVLSALGDGDLDMPALNQQEGTFTNIDKRVVPTNAALPYHGYELNDIASALGLCFEYTIDYTAHLPTKKGYKSIEFDNLSNFFGNDGSQNRGYLLDLSETCNNNEEVEAVEEIKSLQETVIYRANPINQFNDFTNKAHQINEKTGLYLSQEAIQSFGFIEGEKVMVKTTEKEIELEVVRDTQLAGAIGFVPTFDKKFQTKQLFGKYRFAQAEIKKV